MEQSQSNSHFLIEYQLDSIPVIKVKEEEEEEEVRGCRKSL